MNKTFANEDSRKNKLFEAWNKHLQNIHHQFPQNSFNEVYEGIVTVSELSKSYLGVHLDDGRKLLHIQIDPHVSAHSSCLDLIYIVLGKRNEKWWPLEVVSIGSTLGEKEAHLTFNPQLIDSLQHGKSGKWVQ